ncbi:MAG: hypothetical protein IT245_01400 [Bacteroidia bacterium]|nr:hypothetical protein [Bacteroidia bacterium]
MNRYKNSGGNSGVHAYEIGQDYIVVWFNAGGKSYTYSYGKAGRQHVENMKELAINGQGLNSYIMKNVAKMFD